MKRITIEEFPQENKKEGQRKNTNKYKQKKKELLKKNGNGKYKENLMRERENGSLDNTKISIRGMATLIMRELRMLNTNGMVLKQNKIYLERSLTYVFLALRDAI